MPILAGQAHPSGPESRPFSERTIVIQDGATNFIMKFGYPKPDNIVDWTTQDRYKASDSYSVPLVLHYDYRGHFWQGILGGVTFEVIIKTRKNNMKSWSDINSLLYEITNEREKNNIITKGNRAEDRQEWMEPVKSDLNGVPCIRQYVFWGNDPKGEWHYYFPFDENHAIELKIALVDNSDRPGAPRSDWRSRAEAFANRLLSTVYVVIK